MSGTVWLKHQRILDVLESEIRSGRVRCGSRLPGETALAHRFGVSRNTVRLALAELNRTGLITTRTGKGSFVLFDGRPMDTRLGWAHALAAQGVETRVRVLDVRSACEEALAARLRLPSPDVIVVERIRELASGPAISYEHSCVPATGPLVGLPEHGLEGGSLTEALSGAGLYPDRGEQRLSGRRITAKEAALLGRAPGEWFLSTQRTSWTAGGAFVEHVDSLLDPEHFQLSLAFGASPAFGAAADATLSGTDGDSGDGDGVDTGDGGGSA